jgi:hypothetical protein
LLFSTRELETSLSNNLLIGFSLLENELMDLSPLRSWKDLFFKFFLLSRLVIYERLEFLILDSTISNVIHDSIIE